MTSTETLLSMAFDIEKAFELEKEAQKKGLNTFTVYQQKASTTAIYPKERGIEYCILGLCGEAGELANKFKKTIRDGVALNKGVMLDELGDVLWYVSEIARNLNTPLDNLALMNLVKLEKRAASKTISGSGDNR